MAVGNFVAQAPVVDMANNVSGKTVQRPVLPKGIMPSITTTTDTTMPPAFPPPPYEQHGNRGERKSRKGQGQNAVSVATVAAYQQSPNLRALARRVPLEVRLPRPTRHKLTSQRHVGHSHVVGGHHQHHNDTTVVVDTEVRQIHLRVLLSDFGSTSLGDFQNGAALTMERALISGGDGRIDPGEDRRQDVCMAIVIVAGIAVGIAFTAGIPSTQFRLAAMIPSLFFAGAVALFWRFRRIHLSKVRERSTAAVFRNCQLVVLEEAGCDGAGRMPASAEDFDYTLKSYSKSGTLYIVSSRDLVTMRLIQLMKFADPRAAVYLDTPPGQALLGTILPTATEAIAVAV